MTKVLQLSDREFNYISEVLKQAATNYMELAADHLLSNEEESVECFKINNNSALALTEAVNCLKVFIVH